MNPPDAKRKILIIDDEAPVRTMMQRFLSLSGHDVLQAGTGEEGLELLQVQTPDLIFLDLSLPGTDGLAILRTLHEKYANLPVIMMAANEDVPKAHTALNCGASDFIAKPIDHPALKRALQIHLRIR